MILRRYWRYSMQTKLLPIVAITLLAACSQDAPGPGMSPPADADASSILSDEELERARSIPSTAPARFVASDGGEFLGAFSLHVEPDESVYFSFSALNAGGGGSLLGTLLGSRSAVQPERALDGSYTVQFERPLDSTDWLEENLGTMNVANDEVTRIPRVLDLRVDSTGLMTLAVSAVELVVVDGVGVHFGDELTVQGAGRLTGVCSAAGDDGRVLMDPEFEVNEACEHWLSGL